MTTGPEQVAHRSVTVRAPATSANMGPGFDCLGIALDIWNIVTVEVGEFGFEISGEGEDELPWDESNLVFQSITRGDRGVRPVDAATIGAVPQRYSRDARSRI